MTTGDDIYRVAAVRYATRLAPRQDFFLDPQPDPDVPMRIDYFVWAVFNQARTVVVDTGFTAPVAAQRKREYLRTPTECFRMLGVEPSTVEDVVITHMHYDHLGTIGDFPKARIHVQERDLRFIGGPAMMNDAYNHSYELADAQAVMQVLFEKRLVVNEGDADLAPGISLHMLGGHTPGMQVVRVNTARGRIVIASDSSHFYENMEQRKPFGTTFDREDTLRGYEKLKTLADSPQHIVPGHDPLVMERYPAYSADLAGIAVALDAAPSA